MAFHVPSSGLKWLLITFTIGLQAGQNLLPADSFLFLDLFPGPHSSCGRHNLKNSLLMICRPTNEEINHSVIKVQLLEVEIEVGLLDGGPSEWGEAITELPELRLCFIKELYSLQMRRDINPHAE